MMGYVYLLHFERPISRHHTSQHYLGYADDLAARVQRHGTGNGARFVQVAKERGIPFKVARVWRGDRGVERQLKRLKAGPNLCPCCVKRPFPLRQFNELNQDEIDDCLIPF